MIFTSTSSEFQPWLGEALQLIDLAEGERVLQITAQSVRQTQALLDLVGDAGKVLAVEAQRSRAEKIRQIDHPALTVLAHTAQSKERYGLFDALFACPLQMPGWPIDRWGQLTNANLRPGGRFMIDLAAEDFCQTLERAWKKAGGPRTALAQWQGPSKEEMATALRSAGLRRIETALGTHLMRAENPLALAEYAVHTLGGDQDLIDSLKLALTETLETQGKVELVCRRTRLYGMR